MKIELNEYLSQLTRAIVWNIVSLAFNLPMFIVGLVLIVSYAVLGDLICLVFLINTIIPLIGVIYSTVSSRGAIDEKNELLVEAIRKVAEGEIEKREQEGIKSII